MTRLSRTGFLLAACFVAGAFAPPSSSEDGMVGFTPEGVARQQALEARFDAHLEADSLREWMRTLTARPFYVGSPYNREMAHWLRAKFEAWGFDAEIAEYHVLFPTPRVRELTLLEPVRYEALLREPAAEGDPTSAIVENRLPPYNAYSADGDVTAELVYVNYGIPSDYEELERRGIDVRGKIVLARYGGAWRGIKPKVAAERGALGTIIYSDPRDDGFVQGAVYPEGPWRSEHGVQRGSVLDMPLYPGDPLTPGVGATPDAERLAREDAPTLMRIPVLPISYADARPLLEALGGPVAPAAWRGALPLTYRIGPGPARVRLRLEFDWELTPAYNVIARMPGSQAPDEWIIRGNHRDGWAAGAIDPISGLVAMMAEARAVGELAATGWRPARTLVYAAWDAEEPALLGSTEWAEHHAAELGAKAVLYINTDSNGRGFLNAGGSHTLERLVNEVARDVEDPRAGVSIRERARARAAVGGEEEAYDREDLRIAPLGSGSDWTPFLQHLGIPSLMLSFGGESGGGAYHSVYDTFDYFTRFVDPDFVWGVALARTAGRVTLRSAQADILPFRFWNFVDNVARYVEEVTSLAERMREDTERHNRLVAEDLFALAADPTETYVAPSSLDAVPPIDFAPLEDALRRLTEAATSYDEALAGRLARGGLPVADAARLNALLIGAERALIRPEGLPRRPWFRHQVYAPGFYTGYGVKTLPGVREGLEERNWEEAGEQMTHAAAALSRVATIAEEAAAILAAR